MTGVEPKIFISTRPIAVPVENLPPRASHASPVFLQEDRIKRAPSWKYMAMGEAIAQRFRRNGASESPPASHKSASDLEFERQVASLPEHLYPEPERRIDPQIAALPEHLYPETSASAQTAAPVIRIDMNTAYERYLRTQRTPDNGWGSAASSPQTQPLAVPDAPRAESLTEERVVASASRPATSAPIAIPGAGVRAQGAEIAASPESVTSASPEAKATMRSPSYWQAVLARSALLVGKAGKEVSRS